MTGGLIKSKRPKPVPWRRICRDIAEFYGFTPRQVGDMTLYQIRTLTAEKKELGSGTIKMGSGEAEDFQMRVQEGRRLRGMT